MIPHGWRTSTWGAEVDLKYGRALNGYHAGPGSYRVFGTNGPVGWTNVPLSEGPGVILGRKGAYRGVHFSKKPFYVIDTAYFLLPKSDLDMRWVYYAAQYHGLGNIDDGSPIPSTTKAAVDLAPIVIPPLAEQRRIAEILGALDDKIELNRRMNATLEEITRTLFRSWFVDFDPVKIKARGGDAAAELGIAPKIADLFPDSFENSSGDVRPAGWRIYDLGDCVHFAYGKALKEEVRERGSIPVYGSNGQVGTHSKPLALGPAVIVGRKGNPGIVKWSSKDCFIIDTAFYVVDKVGLPMSYWWLTLEALRLKELAGDSAVPGLSRNIAYRSSVVCPPIRLAEHFDRIILPLRRAIDANLAESISLTKTRDYLLPRLLTGSVRLHGES